MRTRRGVNGGLSGITRFTLDSRHVTIDVNVFTDQAARNASDPYPFDVLVL